MKIVPAETPVIDSVCNTSVDPAQTKVRCLSVVIPAYDEQATLRGVVEKVLGLPMVLEVIVVDDCSRGLHAFHHCRPFPSG